MTAGGLPPSAAGGVVDAENPWPGLLSFREQDSRWFQGRQRETDELLRIVKRERLTVLFGLSGLGKTSLLRAGLFPALRSQNILPVSIRLDYAPESLDLTQQVKLLIAAEAAEWNIEAPPFPKGETLWECFHRRDADFWNERNKPVVPLLAFDQFEEIFTLGQADSRRLRATELFLDELSRLVEGGPPAAVSARLERDPEQAEQFTFGQHRYKILLSVREDFLADLEGLRPRMSSVALNRMRLGRMNGEDALSAVDQAPHLIDSQVAEQVVRFVAAQNDPDLPLAGLEVEPALLSVVCRELNTKRRNRNLPKITASLLEGSQEEVLTDFYTRSFESLPREVRWFVEDHLLTVNGYRNLEALDNALEYGITRKALDLLVERRLVRIEQHGGVQRVELTHDRLAPVVRLSRDLRHQVDAAESERTARQQAEERERRALEELQRSRRKSAAFLVLLLLTIAALFAAVLSGRRTSLARAEATRQKEVAETRLLSEEQAKQRAEVEKANAEAATKRAKDSEELAQKERARAEREKGLANAAATSAEQASAEAVAARARADERAQAARASAEEADRQRTSALAAAKLAELAQGSAEQAQFLLSESRDAERRALARSVVEHAARLADDGKPKDALAFLANALRLDPKSMAAQAWIFDLAVRRGVLPEQPPAYQTVSQPGRVLWAAIDRGSRLATGSSDGVARVWNIGSDRPPLSFSGHRGLINFVAFSGDGTRLVTASWDGTARVWHSSDAAASPVVLSHTRPVTGAAFSPDGSRVATVSQDSTVRIWDVKSGAAAGEPWKRKSPITSVAYDHGRILTASWDHTAQVWDAATGAALGPVMRHREQVNSARFEPKGPLIVTASDDGTARVWEGDRSVRELRHAGGVNSAEFSPDGRRIVTASDDQTARVWEVSTGTPLCAPLRHDKRVNSAVFSADGRRIYTASDDGTVRIWDVSSKFDNPALLADFAEFLSGYDASAVPERKALTGDLTKRRANLIESARGTGDTAALVRRLASLP